MRLRAHLPDLHRRLGYLATVLVAVWIASAWLLRGTGFSAVAPDPGTYGLPSVHAASVALEDPELRSPTSILSQLAADSVEAIRWLRLEVIGDRPAYVVSLAPSSRERVYDARTGGRLDPLPVDLLRAMAADQVDGADPVRLSLDEVFDPRYRYDRVSVVVAEMDTVAPAEIVLTAASGRVLSRTDRSESSGGTLLAVHALGAKWGGGVLNLLLPMFALAVAALVAIGFFLWGTTRRARAGPDPIVNLERKIHRAVAPLAGVLLLLQISAGLLAWRAAVGDRARYWGQDSLPNEVTAGLSTEMDLPTPARVSEMAALAASDVQVQRYEWRMIGESLYWLVFPDRLHPGVLIRASDGAVRERLTAEEAAAAAADVVVGSPTGAVRESRAYRTEVGGEVATYRVRFDDPDATDVEVDQVTGEVLERVPAIRRRTRWIARVHTLELTGVTWMDLALLIGAQGLLVVLVGSGLGNVVRMRTAPRTGPRRASSIIFLIDKD